MMCDIRCRNCRERYGFCGEPPDCPPCPRCGSEPDREALARWSRAVDEALAELAAEDAREGVDRDCV